MYARFIRWASDRLGERGVIAFVSNNSFIDARAYDGFRKVVADEFSAIYIVDLKGNSRVSGKRARREGGNVFGVRVGIAVWFFVRAPATGPCRIYYIGVDDYLKAADKKAFLRENRLADLPFEHIIPNANHTWINQPETAWDDLLPLGTKATKGARARYNGDAICRLFTLGVSTNRDEWVLDPDRDALTRKITFFIERFARQAEKLETTDPDQAGQHLNYAIKWSDSLKDDLLRQRGRAEFTPELLLPMLYRPFVTRWYYAEKRFSDRLTANHYEMFGPDLQQPNAVIAVNVGNRPFNVLASKRLVDLHFNGDAQCFPRYVYAADGARQDNLTDWAVEQFVAHYPDLSGLSDLTGLKDQIFAYVYAVLHAPAYREKYALNLKREFPRIPFYDDFAQWAAWGQQLLDLHLHFETATPYPLRRVDTLSPKSGEGRGGVTPSPESGEGRGGVAPSPESGEGRGGGIPKPKLTSDAEARTITLDTETTLHDVPPEAWEYVLGNRAAIDWVLYYYKERKPRDPTIREQFDTYRFADYKETVIDLLQRVVTVSVETIALIAAMRG